mmetsp:Transcript_13370/g.40364  ORF Transcript_13370/g.40364 Transcript_13370/m.40364 type:complete len:210 (-) Transcript_13370:976-1605(-)
MDHLSEVPLEVPDPPPVGDPHQCADRVPLGHQRELSAIQYRVVQLSLLSAGLCQCGRSQHLCALHHQRDHCIAQSNSDYVLQYRYRFDRPLYLLFRRCCLSATSNDCEIVFGTAQHSLRSKSREDLGQKHRNLPAQHSGRSLHLPEQPDLSQGLLRKADRDPLQYRAHWRTGDSPSSGLLYLGYPCQIRLYHPGREDCLHVGGCEPHRS